MGGAYFWKPSQNASGRRNYELQNSTDLHVKINNIEYKGEIKVSCSCKNIYVERVLLVEGKKKRITSLKMLVLKG